MKQHLLERGFDSDKYCCWLSDTQMTVPLYSFDRAMRGLQVYTPNAEKQTPNPKDARYFTRTFGGKQLVWGTEIRPIRVDRILNRVRVQGVRTAQAWA